MREITITENQSARLLSDQHFGDRIIPAGTVLSIAYWWICDDERKLALEVDDHPWELLKVRRDEVEISATTATTGAR